ncbi:methyl-accepting chemotaxis protein [Herbaspirillum lusitanum]|uniref:Methyl-accepting chemotaxis protein n=1 Tax=Herbaspirillum lusitanum TaxID=213312 RepID=A0ABW9ACN3_9BURK
MKFPALDVRARLIFSYGLLLFFIVVLGVHGSLLKLEDEQTWRAMAPAIALFVLGLFIAYINCRKILAPFGHILNNAGSLAAGDVSRSIEVSSQGDLGRLEQALEAINMQMFKMVSEIRLGTTAVASTSDMIVADNTALSGRTEAQASSLEETAAALEQLTANVRQNADNAAQAHLLVETANRQASEGGAVMQQLIEVMSVIKSSSQRIVDIISVIDGIAFQTNILALNAAVEAARAGEQGRGFAVVAAEVRSLAHHSALAAKEIKQLIADSVDKIERGGSLVGTTGRAMNEIATGVARVAVLVGEIAAASAEQSSGISEVNQAVTQLDGATQKNALLVVEAIKVADGLKEQAISLSQSVSGFVLGAREFGNADEAREMVRDAIEYARLNGLASTVAEVKKLHKGLFVDRDLYLIIYSFDGEILAHGSNRRLWGADWTRITDADGKHFNREMTDKLKTAESGWTDYRWVHPLSKEVLVKSGYFEKIGNAFLVCGYYKQAHAATSGSLRLS